MLDLSGNSIEPAHHQDILSPRYVRQMIFLRISNWLACLTIVPIGLLLTSACMSAELELKKGDRICLVGNALGERLQHHNEWERDLYERFPDLELSVRNLCFPGDEPVTRIRSMNFGEPDVHLAHSKASVVLFFFGFNESFAGTKGLAGFKTEIRELISHTQQQNYSDKRDARRSFV